MLLIGAGEMIELCATHFAAQGPARITVANRTLERARARSRTASTAGRSSCASCAEQLHEYDIVGLVHRLLAADPRQGPGRARAARAPPPADVHGRPRGAARHRAGGRASWTTSSSTRIDDLRRDRRRATSTRAARRSSRPRRSSTPRSASSCTGCRCARSCRSSASCATRPRKRAARSSSAR